MGCSSSVARSDAITLLVLGVDNAGKSTFISAVKGDDVDLVAPTVGFSPEEFKLGNRSVRVFDLGGSERFRGIWNRYYHEIHGVVYVVDSADTARFETVRHNLAEEFVHPRLHLKPILLLANKKDLPTAAKPDELRKLLNVDALPLTVQIQACTARRKRGRRLDSGIKAGLKWLLNEIDAKYGEIGRKVAFDCEQHAVEAKLEREEKRARIQARKDAEAAEELRKQQEEAAAAALPAGVEALNIGDGPTSPLEGHADAPGAAGHTTSSPRTHIQAALPSSTDSIPHDLGTSVQPPPRSSSLPPGSSAWPDVARSPRAEVTKSPRTGALVSPRTGGALVSPRVEAARSPRTAPPPRTSSLENPSSAVGATISAPAGASTSSAPSSANSSANSFASLSGPRSALPPVGSRTSSLDSSSGPNLDALISDLPFPTTKLSPKLTPLSSAAPPASLTLNTPMTVA